MRRAVAGPRPRARRPSWTPAAQALFEALRRHRLAVARAEGMAPFIVASDRTLRDIAMLRPRTLAELQEAHGVGPNKAERYGAGFLRIIAEETGEGGPRMSASPPRRSRRRSPCTASPRSSASSWRCAT